MASSNYNPDEIATADMDYSFQEMVTALTTASLQPTAPPDNSALSTIARNSDVLSPFQLGLTGNLLIPFEIIGTYGTDNAEILQPVSI